jgi:NADH:ubiquinone oxidoreductase subunit 3 (subunit A)
MPVGCIRRQRYSKYLKESAKCPLKTFPCGGEKIRIRRSRLEAAVQFLQIALLFLEITLQFLQIALLFQVFSCHISVWKRSAVRIGANG